MKRVCLGALLLAACHFDGGGLALSDDDQQAGPDATSIANQVDAAEHAPDAAPSPDAPHATPGQLRSAQAVGPVNIDGNAAEFAAAGAVPVGYDIASGQLYQAASGYAPSAAVTVRAIHDGTHLYFFAHVDDSVVKTDSTANWNDDGITLFLDVADDASGPFSEDDHALVIRADGDWSDYGPVGVPAALTIATARPVGGYDIEVQVDDDSLSGDVGATVGFDLMLTDDDGMGANTDYDASSMWWTSSRAACPDCCSDSDGQSPWCDTTMYGSMIME